MVWTQAHYDAALAYFDHRAESGDVLAVAFAWLLRHVGMASMYDDMPVYNRLIGVVLTQRISFRKSGLIKKRLATFMGTRVFTPAMLMDALTTRPEDFVKLGIDAKLQRVCYDVSQYVLDHSSEEKELTLTQIEDMPNHVKGFACWSVNVACLCITFSTRSNEGPYNVLTNRDPVIKRGFYWLTGVDPYDAVLDQVTKEYAPYAGVLNRYIWEAFNYERIPVKQPPHYRKWWNKGSRMTPSVIAAAVPQRLSFKKPIGQQSK